LFPTRMAFQDCAPASYPVRDRPFFGVVIGFHFACWWWGGQKTSGTMAGYWLSLRVLGFWVCGGLSFFSG